MGSIQQDVAYLNQPFGHIINGKVVTKASKTHDVVNPASEEVIASIPVATQQTVDDAVDAARKAFKTWGKTTWQERADCVRKWKETFTNQKDDLAALVVAEQGKSHGLAQHEHGLSMTCFQYLPDMELEDKEVIKDETRTVYKRYAPIGVVAAIAPWNFPIGTPILKSMPALLTGNCVILKPSPFTPLCAIRIIEAAQKHFPPGVLQCVVGDDSLGPMITKHPKIDMVSFTGSTQTGKLVAKSCSDSLKRVFLELGGNDVSIILPDVDVEAVAPKVLFSATFNTGQVCCASKRIYVHEEIYDKFANMMKNVSQGMKIGNGFEKDTVHGPITNKMQFDKVSGFFKDSQDQGHKFITGGKIDQGKGFFVPISIVDNPPENSKIVQEEPFGPIFPLLKWKDETDLLTRVNDSPWGLGACVWGKDAKTVDRIARSIETGTVWCNSPPSLDARVPFGGWKQSGYGRESGYEGLIEHCNLQVISVANQA